MYCVAPLEPATAEAQVFEGAPRGVGVQPVGENPLLNRAKLSGSCQNSAAINPDRYLKSRRVLLRQSFGSQLACAVKGNRRLRAKVLSDAGQANCRRPGLSAVEHICGRLRAQWQTRQGRNRINAAGAQQN